MKNGPRTPKVTAMLLMAIVAAGGTALAAPSRPPQIPRVLVWFPRHFTAAYAREQIRAIAQRTPLSAVHIDAVQGKLLDPTSEARRNVLAPGVKAFVRAAVAEARPSCVRVGLDFDFDRAVSSYMTAHPGETLSKLLETSVTLDAQGHATATATAPVALRRLATDFPAVRSGVERAYAYTPAGGGYVPASLVDVTAKTAVTPAGANGVEVSIDAGSAQAGKTVFLLTRHEYQHPDQFSDSLIRFQRSVIRAYRGTGVSEADLDEMGLPNEPQNFQDIIDASALKDLWRQPWMTVALKARYERDTGRDYDLDLLRQRVPPADDPGASIRAIAAYYDELRAGNVRIEQAVYDEAKRDFGRDTFIGVHPTWFAIYPSIYQYEFQRNGLDWWEVPRDIAQVDEGVEQAAKMAIGRRWHSPVTTTMVYGPNFETFLDSAYSEARWNGRVDYDGSGGTDGPDSLGSIISNAMTQNRPEQIAAVEERIKLLDEVARGLPRPRALIVFGYYSQAAWMSSNPGGDSWDLVEPQGNTMTSALQVSRALTDQGYAVDIVPSTEVDAGRVGVNGEGRPTYAGETYSAGILAYPEYSRRATLDWASRVRRLGLIGDATTDTDGRSVATQWATIKAHATVALPGLAFPAAPVFYQASPYAPTTNPGAGVTAMQLAGPLGIDGPVIANGNELDDGTVVITDASRYDPSTPSLDTIVAGHHVTAKGGEFFAVHLDGTGQLDRVAGDHLQSVSVDGKEVLSFDKPYDLALRRVNGAWQLTYRGPWPTDPMLREISDATPVAAARCAQAPDLTPPIVRYRRTSRRGRALIVRWRATDAGRGVADYDVYVRKGLRGPWRVVRRNTTRTRLAIRLRRSMHYAVRVLAYDRAGNVSRAETRRIIAR